MTFYHSGDPSQEDVSSGGDQNSLTGSNHGGSSGVHRDRTLPTSYPESRWSIRQQSVFMIFKIVCIFNNFFLLCERRWELVGTSS